MQQDEITSLMHLDRARSGLFRDFPLSLISIRDICGDLAVKVRRGEGFQVLGRAQGCFLMIERLFINHLGLDFPTAVPNSLY
jgi:hypothetical protein